MSKFLTKLAGNRPKLNFTFKWFKHKKIQSKWVALIESDPLTRVFLDKVIKGINSSAKIEDKWFNTAKEGEEKEIMLNNEMKHSILMGLPNCPPKGKKIISKELKEMKIRKTTEGFIFVYELEAIIEL